MKWLIRNLLTSKQKGTRGKLVNSLTAQTSPSHCSGERFCKKIGKHGNHNNNPQSLCY